jgi:hypothetical protein
MPAMTFRNRAVSVRKTSVSLAFAGFLPVSPVESTFSVATIGTCPPVYCEFLYTLTRRVRHLLGKTHRKRTRNSAPALGREDADGYNVAVGFYVQFTLVVRVSLVSFC